MAILTKSEIWRLLETLVQQEGLGLFDVECAQGMRGVLRVFLCRSNGSPQGIDLEACARVAKRINDSPNVEELIPGDATLEVSSPGINRRLSRPQHFQGAVGERVRLTVRRSGEGALHKETFRGKLLSFDGQTLEIEKEENKKRGTGVEIERVPLAAVQDARTDFPFNS